ncbi:MAG: cyclic pyranopterin monophosphate synthase MoaC [Pirellulaceae bacterium]|nr:cyclic pyranopterin monophosphate synthase MoaC [Pirellulaceae bacterium]
MTTDFSHLNEHGEARIVDIGEKPVSLRRAIAQAIVRMQPETLRKIQDQEIAKGDVLATARLAGIMAGKETSRLIPLCHPIRIDSITVGFEFTSSTEILVQATVQATDRTGVEMEALVAASIAALTIYDMCKGIDRGMTVLETKLNQKTGGLSGDWKFV